MRRRQNILRLPVFFFFLVEQKSLLAEKDQDE